MALKKINIKFKLILLITLTERERGWSAMLDEKCVGFCYSLNGSDNS